MGTINVVKSIKMVYPACMVLVKVGTFYDVYSKDAYIISYLLKYKIKEKEKIPTCSFPVSSLSKVENILEKNKINYIVVDKRNNYDEDQKVINKKENNYDKVFEKAKVSVEIMLRIQKIYDKLLQSRDDLQINNKLEEIEKVLQDDKGRKI